MTKTDQLGIPVMEASLSSVQLMTSQRTVRIADNPSGHEYIAYYRERNFTEPGMQSQNYKTSTSCVDCIYHIWLPFFSQADIASDQKLSRLFYSLDLINEPL